MNRLALVVLGIVAVVVIWAINAPSRFSLGAGTYLVPKSAQFAPGLRSQGEVSLMLKGTDLAAHIPGYHATQRTYLNGEQGTADVPVEFQSGEVFERSAASIKSATNDVRWELGAEIPKRLLAGQEEATPLCVDSNSDDGTPNKMCTFVYRDGGLRLYFLLRDDNLGFAPDVARYALNSLERYRQR